MTTDGWLLPLKQELENTLPCVLVFDPPNNDNKNPSKVGPIVSLVYRWGMGLKEVNLHKVAEQGLELRTVWLLITMLNGAGHMVGT